MYSLSPSRPTKEAVSSAFRWRGPWGDEPLDEEAKLDPAIGTRSRIGPCRLPNSPLDMARFDFALLRGETRQNDVYCTGVEK